MALRGTPKDDIIDGGFLVESADGEAGSDLLRLDYSGTDSAGRAATRVSLGAWSTVSDTFNVTLSDGSNVTGTFANFERYRRRGDFVTPPFSRHHPFPSAPLAAPARAQSRQTTEEKGDDHADKFTYN